MKIRYSWLWAKFNILTFDCEGNRYPTGVEQIDCENTFILIRRV